MSIDQRRRRLPDRIISFENRTETEVPLLEFLMSLFDGISRNDAKGRLRRGQVKLRGEIQTVADTPVMPGDKVDVNLTQPFKVFSHPRLSIVYEDDDILVVNKGYGLLSVGTGAQGKEITAYNILRDYLKQDNPAAKIFVVHRLDKATSGLMMFAKNPEAQEAMQHNWNNMVLSRLYVAVVEGLMEEQSGVIRSNLNQTSQFEVYSTKNTGEGRTATTRYRVLARGNGYSLVEFSLDTGRKNQIRVHARDLGHPIVGDRKYGAKSSPAKRVCLHAKTLRFAHPITRKDMNFELPVPARFKELLRR